jgi:hypothetical protein
MLSPGKQEPKELCHSYTLWPFSDSCKPMPIWVWSTIPVSTLKIATLNEVAKTKDSAYWNTQKAAYFSEAAVIGMDEKFRFQNDINFT